ncbi:hypothetical protein BC361_25390 [Ensifer sp. LC54]|nr:hypothetical protein BC361_25390 [Ensifer sp. LC54]OCP23314.1 hypothetical protein BC363_25375 [Ensifer sp. LC384]
MKYGETFRGAQAIIDLLDDYVRGWADYDLRLPALAQSAIEAVTEVGRNGNLGADAWRTGGSATATIGLRCMRTVGPALRITVVPFEPTMLESIAAPTTSAWASVISAETPAAKETLPIVPV